MASVKDPVSVYLKGHILNCKAFQSSADDYEKDTTIESYIAASGRRILENEVKFEKVPAYGTAVADKLKGKYKFLVANKKIIVESSDARLKSLYNLSPKKSLDKLSNEGLPSPSTQLFPESGIKLGWQGNEPVGAGMLNLGNTCYLNSTLQALFHVPSFCNWLSSEAVHNGSGKCDQAFIAGEMCTICAMAATLRVSRGQTGHVIKPALIYGRLRSICRHLSLGQQEDAHEFLRFLIESMERTFLLQHKGKKLDSLSKETTPLHRIFGGYLRNEVSCHTCGQVSTTFQLFQDLFLDIRFSDSLIESMKNFFSWEKLEGGEKDNCYKCEQCKDRGNCSKRVYIQAPPKVLCIQLKRFTALGKKITKHISYPMKLDLSPYIYNSLISNERGIVKPLPYKLVSIVSHYGTALNCGHYTAIGFSSKGSYFMFDDSQVRPMSISSALNTSAYILMYEMEPNWSRSKGVAVGMNSTVHLMDNNILKKVDSSQQSPKLIQQGNIDSPVSPLRICETNNLKPAPLKLKSYSVNFPDKAKSITNGNVEIEKAAGYIMNNNGLAHIEKLKPLEGKGQCIESDNETKVNNLGSLGIVNQKTISESPSDSPKLSSKFPLKRNASVAESRPYKRQLTLPDLFRLKNKEISDKASSQPRIRTLKDWLVDRKIQPDEKGSRKHVIVSESRRWSVNGWEVTENDIGEEKIACKRKRDEDCGKRKHKLADSEIIRNLSQSRIPFLYSENKLMEGKGRTKDVSFFCQNDGFFQKM